MTAPPRNEAHSLSKERIDAVAFDLDGTIYFGDELAEGASDLLDCLEERGLPYLFFTNNSGKTRADIVAKLRGMGLHADADNTYTSGQATAEFVARSGWRDVACIGAKGMREMLASAGVRCDGPPSEAKALVIALIPGFDETMLPAWLTELPTGLPIVAANMDLDYPVEGGIRKPGCGAIVLAVERLLGRGRHTVVGKPGTFMLDLLCDDHGLDRHRVLVVGDSLDSDIAMARAIGAPSVLIDSSGTSTSDAAYLTVSGLPELRAALCPDDA